MADTTRFWTVTASIVVEPTPGWESVRQVPTFVLDGHVQGIPNIEHAERIARSVIMTGDVMGSIKRVSVSVAPLYV